MFIFRLFIRLFQKIMSICAAINEWRAYFCSSVCLTFRDYWKAVITTSAYITYAAILCALALKGGVLTTMYWLLLAIPFLIAPLIVVLVVFVKSLYPGGRNYLNSVLRSTIPINIRVSDLEAKVNSILETLNRINDTLEKINTTLARHESILNNLIERVEAIERDKTKGNIV